MDTINARLKISIATLHLDTLEAKIAKVQKKLDSGQFVSEDEMSELSDLEMQAVLATRFARVAANQLSSDSPD